MDELFYRSERPLREIRAAFDENTVRVYQAFSRKIALPALDKQELVEPFNISFGTS